MQEVVSAGLEFTIIRTGRTDVQDPEFATSTYVALGAQGSLPQRSQMTKGQAIFKATPHFQQLHFWHNAHPSIAEQY